MANNNSFDRLVSGLSDSERKELLGKMKSDDDSSKPAAMHSSDEDVDVGEFPEQIKQESIILRLWLWIKSIISNTSVEELYNERKISVIAHKIEKVAPGLIDYKREQILSPFYNKLIELKLCADFFRPYVSAVDDADGDFYVFLGSFLMNEVSKEMDSKVDPYSNPVTLGARPEIRMGLLKKMDEIMSSIPSGQKANMYAGVRACEWLKNFCKFSFPRMLTYFTSIVDGVNTCQFGSISGEIGDFAKVMCNGMPVDDEVLHAIYVYAVRNKKSSDLDTSENGNSADSFVTKAKAQLSMINSFIQTVPLKSLCCVVFNDVHPNIGTFTGGEDWFVKYKSTWKKLFDQKWTAWTNDCKKENLRHSLEINFKRQEFPMLPDRPWVKLWGTGLPFRYELTGGFLAWYFKEIFPAHELVLKTIMLEGDFIRKENRVEFTDAFNTLVQVSIDLDSFVRRLGSGGDIGVMLAKIAEEKMRTLQGSQKAEALVRSAESDMASIIVHFGDASRIIELVMSGIFQERTNPNFDGLSNLNHVQGRDNEQFKVKLRNARESVANALGLLKELEPIDTPSFLK